MRTLIVCLLIGATAGAVHSVDPLRVGHFSAADTTGMLPHGWESLAFTSIDQATDYRLVRLDSQRVVRAQSAGGASGLVTRRTVDPSAYPVLEWSWRAESVVEAADATRKATDDYAARLYLLFDYTPSGLGARLKLGALRALGYDEIPARALCYIWATRAPKGQFLPSPYTDWVMMLPVESGPQHTGTWRTYRRNIVADYRAAFGGDGPVPPINGVALMTDTDNTGGTATTYYGDIVFHNGTL
ncbi:DUF3047 domain-containing protein [Salisaeta longa]|uniref:DUF3047 domain-containing protein n=1 Tax=Salisaeta longa TaxID=503170 RepID=UPI0003B5E3C4|nr:DUF3047 domain-containing protein [Salisaeta longa]